MIRHGTDGFKWTAKYEIETNRWATIQHPLQYIRRNEILAFIFADKLYVFGGTDDEDHNKTALESIDLSNTEGGWQKEPLTSPYPLDVAKAFIVDERVYICPGWSHFIELKDEKYRLVTAPS